MRNNDRRIAKLVDQFTARERAVLVLRSRKEGRDADTSWRWSMPDEQVGDFNHLIDLMNGVNDRLMPVLLVLGLEAEKLALRLGVLGVLALWYVQAENSAWLLGHECPKAKLAADALTHAPRLPVMHLDGDVKAIVDEATEGVEASKLDELALVHKERLREDLQGARTPPGRRRGGHRGGTRGVRWRRPDAPRHAARVRLRPRAAGRGVAGCGPVLGSDRSC